MRLALSHGTKRKLFTAGVFAGLAAAASYTFWVNTTPVQHEQVVKGLKMGFSIGAGLFIGGLVTISIFVVVSLLEERLGLSERVVDLLVPIGLLAIVAGAQLWIFTAGPPPLRRAFVLIDVILAFFVIATAVGLGAPALYDILFNGRHRNNT